MIDKANSRIGFFSSLAIHSLLFGGLWASFQNKPIKYEDITSISIELIASRLEQEQVAVAPEVSENVENSSEIVAETQTEETAKMLEPESEPEKRTEIQEITPIPKADPKPKEKPKEKPKSKPKEKPQEKPKEPPKDKAKLEKNKTAQPKPSKALETGKETRQGVVAKAIPNAFQGTKNQAGIPNGAENGNNTKINQAGSAHGNTIQAGQNNAGNANEFAAYRATLLRSLQQRANNSYPQREKMMRKMGTVMIKFTLSASGQISNVQVVKSSGNDNLDAAAVKAAQNTKPPAPPAGYPNAVSVPIRFVIQ